MNVAEYHVSLHWLMRQFQNNMDQAVNASKKEYPYRRYACSFILLQDVDSIDQQMRTIESVSEFISTSQLVDREYSEIIYIWKGQTDQLPPIIGKLGTGNGLGWWNSAICLKKK